METIPESPRLSQTEITPSWLDFDVSIVANARSTTTAKIRVGEALDHIRSGKYRVEIENIRRTYSQAIHDGQDAKSIVKPLKKDLPAILWSGQFSTRTKAVPLPQKLLQHSSLLCADLDDLPDDRLREARDKLRANPHVVAIFRSPTNSGLKVLFRVPADVSAHLGSFLAIEKHVRDLTGCEIDEACKDVTRLCFVSYDPEIWTRDDEPQEIEIGECTQRPQTTQSTHTVCEGGEVSATPKVPSVPSVPSMASISSVYTIDQAVELALPRSRHTSHRLFYKFAGALWAYEETTGTTIAHDQLRGIFRQWYVKGRPFLNPQQPESEYFVEFMDAWRNVEHPLRENAIEKAWKIAVAGPIPPEALAADLPSPNLRRLISLCRELQLLHGSEPFYLSPYVVMKLFEQNTASTAAKWLSGLCGLKILTIVVKGDYKQRRATSYLFNIQSPP